MKINHFKPPFEAIKNTILFHPNWLTESEADLLFKYCLSMKWQEETITLFGKRIIVPRRVIWMGDKDAEYTYAKTHHAPCPWSKPLYKLKEKIEHELGLRFNSVLGNLYQDGSDYMGWHQDNETELGEAPTILSLSLGAARRFCFRHIDTKEKHEIILTHGSALLMQNDCQKQYQHTLPKSLRIKKPRINLTFRKIHKG